METESEPCLKEGSHENPPLDCLTCPRPKTIPHELVYNYYTLDGAFVSGKRMAMFEMIMAFSKLAPLSPEQEHVLLAVGTRLVCAYDRGITYENQIPFIEKVTEEVLFGKLGKV